MQKKEKYSFQADIQSSNFTLLEKGPSIQGSFSPVVMKFASGGPRFLFAAKVLLKNPQVEIFGGLSGT